MGTRQRLVVCESHLCPWSVFDCLRQTQEAWFGSLFYVSSFKNSVRTYVARRHYSLLCHLNWLRAQVKEVLSVSQVVRWISSPSRSWSWNTGNKTTGDALYIMHFASEKKPIRAFCISEMSTHKLIQSQNFSPISCPHSARNLHSNLVHHKVLSANTLPLQIFPSGASPDYALDQSVALARPHWNRIQTFCSKCLISVSLFFWLV